MAISPERASRLAVVWPAGAVMLTILALGVVSVGLSNPDRLVTASFAAALETRQIAADRFTKPAGASVLAQLSGSEEFWLNARTPSAAVPVALKDKVRIGDRVTFGSGTDERRFEVVDISALGAFASGDAATAAPLMLVTCRDIAAPDGPALRFVIERTDMPAGATPRTPHAL